MARRFPCTLLLSAEADPKAPATDSDLTGEALSNISDQDPAGGGFRDGLGAGGESAAYGAADLRGMLERMADRFGDNDERQLGRLRELQSRIVHLAEEANPASPIVPPDLASAFARIEDGITALNRRVATEDEPDHDGMAAPQAHPSRKLDPAESPVMDNEESHWDRASAEALARLYEPDLTGGHHEISSPHLPASEPTRDSAGPADEAHAAPAADDARDDEHSGDLEQRFDSLAERIEQTLAGFRPESSLSAIEARIDGFTQRMDSAFGDLATRADIEKLSAVETSMREVSQHLDRTRDHLRRLDDIESHLRTVVEQNSNDRFGQPLDQPSLSESDVVRLAEAVVHRLEERHLRLGDDSEGMDAVSELRDLVERFVTSQRQGEESTAGALATIQQAILNVLERMEALEQAHAYMQAAAHHGLAEQASPAGHRHGDAFDLRASSTTSAIFSTAATQESAESWADGTAETVAPIQASREEFLAAARRAARKASSLPADEQVDHARVGSRGRVASTGRQPAGSRPVAGLVVATLALVLAVGIGLTTYSIYRDGLRRPSGTVERGIEGPEKSGLGALGRRAPENHPAKKGAAEVPASKEAAGRDNSYAPESAPEFVIEDPPVAPAPTDRQEDDAGRRTATGLPGGILIDTGPVVTTRDAAQVRPQSPVAPIPQSRESVPSHPPKVAETETSSNNRTLPPTAIGPLSLRLAAANGDPAAEFQVALRFAEGKGVKQDLSEAARWYQRSAARGYAPAQYRLGTLYERGLGVKMYRGRAMAWYRSAAEKGNVKAMHNLAVLNASGNRANYRTAAYWFAEAAARGLGDSQYNLAVLYETGRGVDRDLRRAFMWFALAARGGDKEATDRRDRVKVMLDATQLETAEALVRSWKPASVEPLVNEVRVANEARKQG